eukprot:scaffold24174_cov127-Isochrysis_galbana.AAC.5
MPIWCAGGRREGRGSREGRNAERRGKGGWSVGSGRTGRARQARGLRIATGDAQHRNIAPPTPLTRWQLQAEWSGGASRVRRQRMAGQHSRLCIELASLGVA